MGKFALLPRRKYLEKKRDLFASSFAVSRYGAGSPVAGVLSTSGKRIPKKPEARTVTSRAFRISGLACSTKELISSFLKPIRIGYFCYHSLLKLVLINDYQFSFNSVLQLKLF